MRNEPDYGGDTAADDESLGRLLRLAGRRDGVPADAESRVYDRVLAEWQSATARPDAARVYASVHRSFALATTARLVRRWTLPLAAAASIVIAFGWWRQPDAPPAPVPAVASVVRVAGDAAGLPPAGSDIAPGTRLATGRDEGIGLRLAGNQALRVGAETVVVLETQNSVRVLLGRVYVDSGDLIFSGSRVRILTPSAEVTDVGTQFAVGVRGAALEVAVREGRVDIERPGVRNIAVAGERLTIDAAGTATIDSVPAHDGYWKWASDLAAPFEIENRSVLEFLRWAARETGRELVFEDQELRLQAMRTDLHGSVAGIEPLLAVESVLATTRFHFRIEADRIVIHR